MAYFDKYGVEFSDDCKTLVCCPNDFQGEYIIPNSVIYIEDGAFAGCCGLTSVIIPKSVTSIGDHAFEGCGLNSPICINNVFAYMPTSYSGVYTIPNNIKSIIGGAFSGCIGLTSIVIPNSVISIGDGAFYGCHSLKSVTIPDSVTRIGECAFYECSGLTSVTIPRGITRIEGWVFAYCSGLTSVSILDSVISIGEYAFYECSRLQSFSIPNNVTNIEDHAFDGCQALASVVIPNKVTHIGKASFFDCSALTSIIIPNNITSIGEEAFMCCSGLTSLTIPNSVTHIGERAFMCCFNLSFVSFPDSVTHTGDAVFSGCSSINLPIYNAQIFAFMPNDYNGEYSIPNGIKHIIGEAFWGCNLTAVNIPNSVVCIGKTAFRACNNLKGIYIPQGQKERFVKMNALSEYKNIIVEDSQQGRIRTSQSIGTKRIRTWEECLKEWDENKLDYRVKSMFGIHLTIDEYNIFKKEKRNIEQIHGWCNSGKYIHEMERLCSHLPSSDNPSGVGNNIGLKTPRKGFYRVIDVLDDKERTLVCYYNYHDPNEFVEEEVDISSKPLYNKASIGPKDYQLRVGDILHVKEDVQLVEGKYDGEAYTAYKIVWDYDDESVDTNGECRQSYKE